MEPTSTNPDDTVMVIIFTLFVGSMVNERIIDFIKLQIPDLWLKAFNYKEELKRRKRLWLLAFFMGIVTTTILNINLITLLKNQVPETGSLLQELTEWAKKAENKNVALAVSWIVTALFISLGSKFWHDLLDLVLFLKNSKRKIENFESEEVADIKAVEKYLSENDYEIAQKTLQANLETLRKNYPDASLNIGYEFIKQEFRLCIIVCHRTLKTQPLGNIGKPLTDILSFKVRPSQIRHITEYGYAYHFPIIEYTLGEVSVTDDSGWAVAGGGLFNSDNEQSVGTFGCIVKDHLKDYYLLTCYHCVRVPNIHPWEQFNTNNGKNEVKYFTPSQPAFVVGIITNAYRDSRMDIAIIKPYRKKFISDYRWFSNQTVPMGVRKVDEKDAQKRTRVWFSGKKSGNSEGFIINFGFSEKINYKDGGNLHELNNLIVFSKTSARPYQQPCQPGDSGAILIDANTREALGMIVASNEQFGYAIPLYDILETNGLSILSNPKEISSRIS